MTNREYLALLLLMLLAALLLGCDLGDGVNPTCDVTPIPNCGALWMDCEGWINDYQICDNATGLQYAYIRGGTWFTYVHCDTGVRTQLLPIAGGCNVVWR